MKRRFGRWVYGDRSYGIAHILIGIIVMVSIGCGICYILKQPLDIVLALISNDTVGLSASLLGFQLAGVSILITLDGNKKLLLLKEIDSDTMIYKVFLSSITMFLISIVLMLISLNFFPKLEESLLNIKTAIDYGAVAFFAFGFIFLLSSIRLLKWFCSK